MNELYIDTLGVRVESLQGLEQVSELYIYIFGITV